MENKKLSVKSFEEKFEIIFIENQMICSNQKQAYLKNKETSVLTPTNIFSESEELGKLIVLENFCEY